MRSGGPAHSQPVPLSQNEMLRERRAGTIPPVRLPAAGVDGERFRIFVQAGVHRGVIRIISTRDLRGCFQRALCTHHGVYHPTEPDRPCPRKHLGGHPSRGLPGAAKPGCGMVGILLQLRRGCSATPQKWGAVSWLSRKSICSSQK